jgi:DNA-directed RNA polymerase specialized sigma24 family protein
VTSGLCANPEPLLPEILEQRRQGKSLTEIGRSLGLSLKAVSRALRRAGAGEKKQDDDETAAGASDG